MLRIGIVGFGFMGRMHYANWSKCANAKVVAICDTDPNIIENSKKAGGNIEGADQAVDFDSMTVYSEYEKMLADQCVDVVSITLPTFLHASFSVKALEAGVHVLCEKPMALDLASCEQMIAASKTSDKIFQIGHCIRFWQPCVIGCIRIRRVCERKLYPNIRLAEIAHTIAVRIGLVRVGI